MSGRSCMFFLTFSRVFMCDVPMLVHIYPCILKESPRSTLVSLLFSTLIFEIKSLAEPRVNQLASKASKSSCLCLRLKLHACTSVLVCFFFLIGSGHLDSKHFTPWAIPHPFPWIVVSYSKHRIWLKTRVQYVLSPPEFQMPLKSFLICILSTLLSTLLVFLYCS